MIDNFAIALTHLLLALVALRLVMRADLDRDPEPGADPQVGGPDVTGRNAVQPRKAKMEVRRA